MFIPSSFSIIRSSKKKNIQYVAAGVYQIEFFTYANCEYFSIYLWQNGAPKIILLPLSTAEIKNIGDGIFNAVDGKKKYVIVIERNEHFNKVTVTRILWGWFRFRRFSGKVSNEGVRIVEENIGEHVSCSAL